MRHGFGPITSEDILKARHAKLVHEWLANLDQNHVTQGNRRDGAGAVAAGNIGEAAQWRSNWVVGAGDVVDESCHPPEYPAIRGRPSFSSGRPSTRLARSCAGRGRQSRAVHLSARAGGARADELGLGLVRPLRRLPGARRTGTAGVHRDHGPHRRRRQPNVRPVVRASGRTADHPTRSLRRITGSTTSRSMP